MQELALNVNREIITLNQQVLNLQEAIAQVETLQRLSPSDPALPQQVESWKQSLSIGQKALAHLKAKHPYARADMDYAAGEDLMCVHLLLPQALATQSVATFDPALAELQAKLDQL